MFNEKPRVLIVDDSASARARYRYLLEEFCSEIVSAENGGEAFNIAVEQRVDLVITDVEMPKMSGIELCRKLKTEKSTQEVPIIIVSLFDSDRDIEAGFEAGASAYLSKSELDQMIVNTVRDVLWKFQNLRQKRILVVEDSRSIARFVEVGLSRNMFQVTIAGNGKIAQKIMEQTEQDLVLCDLRMPEMDGFALCKWMKSTQKFAHIPFVAMSAGDGERTAVQQIIQFGAASYISKPFSMNQLVPLIERILSDHFRILMKERERLDLERSALVNSFAGLVTALEARDPYTKGHSMVVSDIISGMLTVNGADESDIELAAIGGKLHDIGKIGIRDSVLLKPDRLTEEEFAHIKQHPIIGKEILSTVPSLVRVIPIAYSHHERWDGKGYPLGLKGREIPSWARITSVADTFEAITSNRPYRAGMPLEKAFQIIREVRETQLCPESVDLFFAYTQSKEFQQKYHLGNQP